MEEKLGFRPQKIVLYNNALPYADEVDAESNRYLAEIKYHLGDALLRNAIIPEAVFWMEHIAKYIKLYGFKWSKEDHLHFVHTVLSVITIPELALPYVQKLVPVVTALLKKPRCLTRDDLQIDWRPLYNLVERALYVGMEHFGLFLYPSSLDGSLRALVRSCRLYFSVESTQEMLDEWRHLLCPFDVIMSKGIFYFDLFLCTKLPPDQYDRGFKLWFDEFIKLWEACKNNPVWEGNMLWLFARLARDNIGYIDWEPYIPMIFNRLMRSFNLPGARNSGHSQKNSAPDIIPFIVLIVSMLGGGSSCQLHLNRLFKAIESYYHPSNNGRWMVKLQRLLHRLSSNIVKRVNIERYRTPTWETTVPLRHRLTDAEITEFVVCLKPVALLAMFNKGGITDTVMAFHYLALLRPELIIPPVIERLYSSLETLTEPHRLTAAMQCIVVISRSMVRKNSRFPEGPTHVLSLLMGTLPGIDPNDIKKCLSTFHLIATISTLILLVDCSKSVDKFPKLTQVQRDLCLGTAAFEDFVLQFMDRCFALIENSCVNNPSQMDRHSEYMSSEESIMEICLSSTFSTLLSHCSPEICKAAVNKLYSFVCNRVFGIKFSGKNVANMCRAASRVNPELVLKLLVPHFSRLILALTESEEIFKEVKVDSEITFSLLILAEIVRCDGKYVLQHVKDIEMVLKSGLRLICRDAFYMAAALLRTTLKAFTLTGPTGACNLPNFSSRCESDDVYLLLSEWGKPGDFNHVVTNLHVPSDEELQAVQRLMELFLLPELEFLENWAKGDITCTREKMQNTLHIVDNCLCGAASAFPLWDMEPLHLNETPVHMQGNFIYAGSTKELHTPDGKNYRLLILEVIQKVQDHMLKTCEDDTKSLIHITKIYNHLVFHWGPVREEFETKYKGFQVVKKIMSNKLYTGKQHVRSVLADRISLQHEMRMLERNKYIFTEGHAQIMRELMKLSVSHYYDVRAKAQSVLNSFFHYYDFSYKIILPQLLESLAKDPTKFHEEFKGALYVVVSHKQNSLLVSRHWNLLNHLWPAVVSAQHSEKPSIIKLIDIAIHNLQKFLYTNEVELQVPNECHVQAMKFWGTSSPNPSGPCPSNEEIMMASEILKQRNESRKGLYYELVWKVVLLLENNNLHWRQYHLAFTMLLMLMRYDLPFPAPAVQICVKNLIHETLAIRKGAISGVGGALKQQKRKHPMIEIDPTSPELNKADNPYLDHQLELGRKPCNMWLQYNSTNVPSDQASWDQMRFVHKTHVGFYCWEKPFKVYAPDSEQPKLDRTRDELSEEERVIYDLFIQPEFVEKLVTYLKLEERKGRDKFDAKRFILFKGLFRNFGDAFLLNFLGHLRTLSEDKQESHQRCAGEIICGLLRGSKHWDFQKQLQLKECIKPILVIGFKNVFPETLRDWATCIATVAESRDPNKIAWVFELLMEGPAHEKVGSFLEASQLFILLGALMQQEWRVCELLHRALAYLMPRLNHPYHNVREKIGSLLGNIFMFDVPLNLDSLMLVPKRVNFLKNLLPRITILESNDADASPSAEDVSSTGDSNHILCDEETAKKKDAKNLFHTICRWMTSSITRTQNNAPPDLYQVLPILCSMKNDTSDAAFHRDLTGTFNALSLALLSSESIEAAISALKEVAQRGSWHSRSAAVLFLQNMVFANIFTLMHHEPWMKEIESFVLQHLHDDRVEVREAAAETLSGLLHCEVLKVTDNLLSTFKNKCYKKLRQKRRTNDRCKGPLLEPEELQERHAGILGLCACINAFPYDVPEFMPEVLVFLADHLHEPPPIQTTIKKTLSNFRRTHYDSWRDHKLKFTEDQLAIITDLLVSPSYYA